MQKIDFKKYTKDFYKAFNTKYEQLDKKDYFRKQDRRQMVIKKWSNLPQSERERINIPNETKLNEYIDKEFEQDKKFFKERYFNGTTKNIGFGLALFNYINNEAIESDITCLRNYLSNNDNRIARFIFKEITGIEINTMKKAYDLFPIGEKNTPKEKKLSKEESFEKMKAAKVQKELDKKIRYKGQIMTYKQVLESSLFTHKRIHVQEYASKKINGEYAKLKKPKLHYGLWNDQGIGIDVPKTIYDYSKLEERK